MTGTVPILVVKLGGSHAFSPLLRRWLAAIAGAAGPVVLVPGGGPFADAVRGAQGPVGFDDGAAHRMALLAMTQFGIALTSLCPAGALVEDDAAIAAALRAGRLPVWSPWPMLRDAPAVPASWDVTSDSLALWLATRLGAPRVLLVKQRGMTEADDVARSALAGGSALLDAAFPSFLARYHGEVFIAGPGDLPAALDPAHPPGRRLAAAVPA